MNFHELISRADDETLQDLLGRPVVKLLARLDSQLARPANLRKLILQLQSPADLLQVAHARRLLLQLMPMTEAKQLCEILGLSPTPTPFAALDTASFARGSRRERILFGALDVEVAEAPDDDDTFPGAAASDYPLFEHQRRAVRDVASALSTAPMRVVLHMPTGAGKTRTAMNVVANTLRAGEPRLAVWLAASEELCQQAAEEFVKAWQHLGDRPLKVFRFWGEHDEVEAADVRDGFVVMGFKKAFSAAKRDAVLLPTLGDRCAIVVIDEAHQAIAETYRLVLGFLARHPDSRLLGLTATPGRTWNDPAKDERLAEYFGRKKVTLTIPGFANPVHYLTTEGYLARATVKRLPSVSIRLDAAALAQISNAIEIPDSILEQLADDELRNLLILTEVERLARHHRRILVFAASVRHARVLAAVLRARRLSAAAVTSATPSGERARLIAEYKDDASEPRILCNFGVLTTGFDAPRTSAAVIARPTKSLVLFSQMIGRATRGPKASGNAEAEIVTVVDTSLPGFGDLSDSFNNWEDVWQ